MDPDEFRPLDRLTAITTCLFVLTGVLGIIYAAVTAILS